MISSCVVGIGVTRSLILGCGAEHILSGKTERGGDAVPYELPELPYDYNALEPTIDEQTMRIHHGKHHQAYVDNLNKAIEGTEFDGRPIEALLGALLDIADDKQTVVRNNGGGHANHSLFWQIMKPGGGGEPTGDLADAINDLWDGTDALKTAMNDNGVKRFGSGW